MTCRLQSRQPLPLINYHVAYVQSVSIPSSIRCSFFDMARIKSPLSDFLTGGIPHPNTAGMLRAVGIEFLQPFLQSPQLHLLVTSGRFNTCLCHWIHLPDVGYPEWQLRYVARAPYDAVPNCGNVGIFVQVPFKHIGSI